jgi:uncharacterized membrane protein
MNKSVAIRSKWDRVRYSLLLEATLIALIVPAVSIIFDRPVTDSGALAIILCVKALIISMIYNYLYDRMDAHFGRIPTERSLPGRIVHALGFELVLTATSLPIIVWWLDIPWLQALVMDVVLMAWVVVHTFFFTLAYDRLFPVLQPGLCEKIGYD